MYHKHNNNNNNTCICNKHKDSPHRVYVQLHAQQKQHNRVTPLLLRATCSLYANTDRFYS